MHAAALQRIASDHSDHSLAIADKKHERQSLDIVKVYQAEEGVLTHARFTLFIAGLCADALILWYANFYLNQV